MMKALTDEAGRFRRGGVGVFGEAGILGITLRQCERILASLKQKGLIARVGANKGGHWKIRL